MYKVIFEGAVIDLLEDIKYAKYLKRSKAVVVTDKGSANCIIASNNTDIYHLSGLKHPDNSDIKTVTVVPITADEYRNLVIAPKSFDSLVEEGLRTIKQNKVQAMRQICQDKIVSGCDILLSDDKFHHFEFSIEDQLNLQDIKYDIMSGVQSFIYHETGQLCREFSADDMRVVIDTLQLNKQKHLEYFNELKNKIYSLQSIDDVINVRYEL